MAALRETDAGRALTLLLDYAGVIHAGNPTFQSPGKWNYDAASMSITMSRVVNRLEAFLRKKPACGVIFATGEENELSATINLQGRQERIEHVTAVDFRSHSVFIASEGQQSFDTIELFPEEKILKREPLYKRQPRPVYLPAAA